MERDERMRALTLWPEWAWAVTHLDKRIENRGYPPPRSAQTSSGLVIHAGKYIGGTASHKSTLLGMATVVVAAQKAGWAAELDSDNLAAEFRKRGQVEVMRAGEIVRGALVAVVNLGPILPPGGIRRADEPWGQPASWWWPFRTFRRLEQPVPIRGRQGVWTVPAAERQAVNAQVGR